MLKYYWDINNIMSPILYNLGKNAEKIALKTSLSREVSQKTIQAH